MQIDQTRKRVAMVDRQLRRRGIDDAAVLNAMRHVPRERFLPDALAEHAYDDSPLPLTENQTISQPYIVALMTAALELAPTDRVLEIGAGSGYSSAVLAEIAGEVFAIERHPSLADSAARRLKALGYDRVHVHCGDGTLGWPAEAPFDAIVVTASGPGVPESLRRQLAIGGRLVIPVGPPGVQRLLRIRRIAEDRFDEEHLGSVLFVPLIGAEGWDAVETPSPSPPPSPHRHPPAGPAGPAEAVAAAAEPFDRCEDADLAGLLDRIGDAQVILLGEATHGTAEFYDMRARLTHVLIAEKGVRIVAVEADWPDAHQIDRFIQGGTAATHPERAFERFPAWMWANRQALGFIRSLRARNAAAGPRSSPVRFYGLDLYSLHTSIRAVLAYLDDIDPDTAEVARASYSCLEPWQDNPSAYGAAAGRGRLHECSNDVVAMLENLLDQRLQYAAKDGDRFFDAVRNAALIKGAEAYYRALYEGAHHAWNVRDRHMFETLQALLSEHGRGAKAVVWAHNSHLGNAAATSMGVRGETNLGELCRDAFGHDCYAIGFGTDHGTVAAADNWGAPMRVMEVRPGHEQSYEHVCHESGVERFLLPLAMDTSARDMLLPERLERAIGVIYRPQTERASHYFHASLPRQFDEWIWFDRSRAVDALAVETDPSRAPVTFPFGL